MTASVYEVRLEGFELLDVDLGLAINSWCRRISATLYDLKWDLKALLSFIKK